MKAILRQYRGNICKYWPTFPMLHQYWWKYIAPILSNIYCANIGAILCNIGQHFQYCTNIGENILRQYRVTFIAPILAICGLRWPMKVILRQYRGNICNVGQHYQCCTNVGSNILRQYRITFIAPTFMWQWLGGVVVRASDSWSTGCEFDFRPCTAGLVFRKLVRYLDGWLSVGG